MKSKTTSALSDALTAIALVVLALVIAIVLTGCGESPPPVAAPVPQYQQPAPVAQAPAPVIVQAAPQQDNFMRDALIGGALGYMAGSSGRNNAAPQQAPVVINKTYVTKTYNTPPVAKPVAPPPAPKPVALLPPPKPAAQPPAPRPAAPPPPRVSYSFTAPARSTGAYSRK